MKVFGNINTCGNKAENLHKLYSLGIRVPQTIIFSKSHFNQIENISFFSCDKYIIRPSYYDEDNINYTFAGKYTSYICESIDEIILHAKKLGDAEAIILQEYIECDYYGVYFTRNPTSILLKGYYEFSDNHEGITAGKNSNNHTLNTILNKELEYLGNKIEHMFQYPQDIELGIKDNQFTFFQSRNITTGNNIGYSYKKLINLNGIYNLFDFDEFGSNHDHFTYDIINKIIPCIYLNKKIYIKKSLKNTIYICKYLFLKQTQGNNKFHEKYKIYLKQKYLYKLKYLFNTHQLNIDIIKEFYSLNTFNFQLKIQSQIHLFTGNISDKKTSDFIACENLKGQAFLELEKLKTNYIDIVNIVDNEIITSQSLVFYKGILMNSNSGLPSYQWIYKGLIQGTLISINNIQSSTRTDNILYIENFDLNIYDILDKIQGIIVKNGNQLSHNSIVIREHKIPCIIQYKKYDDLHEGKKITVQ